MQSLEQSSTEVSLVLVVSADPCESGPGLGKVGVVRLAARGPDRRDEGGSDQKDGGRGGKAQIYLHNSYLTWQLLVEL